MSPPGGGGPEQIARREIDKLLTDAGWIVQGYADYLLSVDGEPRGALERPSRWATA